MYSKILLAVDLAATGSGAALAQVGELARAGNALVRLIHVRPQLIEAVSNYLPSGFMEKDEAAALARLTKLGVEAGVPADRVSAASPSGSVHRKVLSEAEIFGADLIAVLPHTNDLSGYILGSNAARIVSRAKCSVLVMR